MAGFMKHFAERMGYQNIKNSVYGRTNGIFMNAILTDSSSLVVRAYVKRYNGIDLLDINGSFLDRRWKGLKVFDAQADEISIWMNVSCLWAKDVDNLAMFIQELSKYLAEHGYASGCCFCSTSQQLGYTEQDGWVMEICDACHEKFKKNAESSEAERNATGSYLRGALGAALGGVLGVLPWILIGMLGYVAAISGFIMAWLSYKGYQLLGGKRGRGMVWIIILVLIVFTYVGVISSEYVNVSRQLQQSGYSMTENAFWVFLTLPFAQSEDMGMIWFDLVLGWLFAGLGSFSMLRRAGRESKGKDLAVKRISRD